METVDAVPSRSDSGRLSAGHNSPRPPQTSTAHAVLEASPRPLVAPPKPLPSATPEPNQALAPKELAPPARAVATPQPAPAAVQETPPPEPPPVEIPKIHPAPLAPKPEAHPARPAPSEPSPPAAPPREVQAPSRQLQPTSEYSPAPLPPLAPALPDSPQLPSPQLLQVETGASKVVEPADWLSPPSSLPARPELAAEPAPPPVAEPLPAAPQARSVTARAPEPLRVLLVEDEPVSQLVTQSHLEKLGHECVVAGDANEAIRLYHRQQFDAIISSYLMPGMNGIDLCRKIREDSRGGYSYFILLTAVERKEEAARALEAGVDAFLTKPLDPNELAVRLKVARGVQSRLSRVYSDVPNPE